MAQKERSKYGIAAQIAEEDNSLNHAMMTSCETYGMTWGCDTDCPVLVSGNCDLMHSENKELWLLVNEDIEDDNEKYKQDRIESSR